MSLSGNIGTFPLAELLQWFSITRKSGILTLLTGKDTVNLFIKNGILVSAETDAAARRLGQYLLSRGFITELQLKQALDAQEKDDDRKLLGNIMREQGVLDGALLRQALLQRAEEIVYDLFLLEEGQFMFRQDAEFPPEALIVELSLNLNQLVLEGVRRSDEWKRFRTVFPSDAILVKLRQVGETDAGNVDSLYRKLARMLSEDRTIGELAIASRRSPYEVYRALYDMVSENVAETVPPPAEPAPPPQAPEPDLGGEEYKLFMLVQNRRFREARAHLEEIRYSCGNPVWWQKRNQWLDQQELVHLHNELARDTVPRMRLKPAEVRHLDLSPQEGYILSRLHEGMDVRELSQIMPLAELDLLRVLLALEKKGVIRL
jgi:hypothetical protein